MRLIFLILLLVGMSSGNAASWRGGDGSLYPDPVSACNARAPNGMTVYRIRGPFHGGSLCVGSPHYPYCHYSCDFTDGKEYNNGYAGADLMSDDYCPAGYHVDDVGFCRPDDPLPSCPEFQKRVHYLHPDGHSVSICINSTDDVTDGPDACKDTDRFYQEDPKIPGLKLCTTQCLTGSLDHFCLAPKEGECTKDSPNYVGYLGWGSQARAYCHQSCPAGSTFGVVETDGVRFEGCIPTDAQPPQCAAGGVVVLNDFGFVCESPIAGNEPPEQPNTDTDGDGIPDVYKPENDPLAELKELAKVNKNLNKSNDRLGNLDNKMDGVNKNLKDGLGNLNQTVKGISDKLTDATKGPDGQERWLNAKTFGESTELFMEQISGAPLIAPIKFQDVHGSCPVYTVDISSMGLGNYSIDFHCQIMSRHGPMLGLVFLGVYALVGIRIIFSS